MKKRDVLLTSFFIISLLVFVFQSSSFLKPFDVFGGWTNGIRTNLYSTVHAQSQNSTFAKLEAENTRLKEQLLEMENLKNDNDALRSQFQETFIQSNRLLPAKVVGFKGKYSQPTGLLIDQGERAGVKKNAAVIVGKNLIGKVENVNSSNAQIILVNSPKFSTLVYDAKTNAPGIVTGQEDFLLLDHVVITDEIGKNNQVLTKGEVFENGAIIPEGLLVGTITQVEKLETKPFQSGVVENSVRFTKLLTVFIVFE